MKNVTVFTLVILLGLVLAGPIAAHAGGDTSQQIAQRNNARLSKKFIKNQRKDQRKALRAQRKNMRQRGSH